MSVLAGSLPNAAVFFLSGLAFSLVYLTTRKGLFHLAQGGVMIIAVSVFNQTMQLDIGLFGAILAGLAAGLICGLLIEIWPYQFLRRRQASANNFLLLSFGSLIVLNQVALIWLGTEPLYVEAHRSVATRVEVLGAQLTSAEIASVIVACIAAGAFATLFSGCLGQRLEAVRQSSLIYDWHGGNSTLMLVTFSGLSGLLAASAGILHHLDHKVSLESAAFGHLIPAFVVVLLAYSVNRRLARFKTANRRSAKRERMSFVLVMVFAALLISILARVTTIYGDPRWQDTVLLLIAIGCVASLGARRIIEGEEAAIQ